MNFSWQSHAPVAADVTADGNVDLLFVDDDSSDRLALLAGDGMGDFLQPVAFAGAIQAIGGFGVGRLGASSPDGGAPPDLVIIRNVASPFGGDRIAVHPAERSACCQ